MDRQEKAMMALFEGSGIEFTRPDVDHREPTTLDFYLPAFNLYVEIKGFHSERIARQLSKVPEKATAIVLQGPNAVRDFARLCTALKLDDGLLS